LVSGQSGKCRQLHAKTLATSNSLKYKDDLMRNAPKALSPSKPFAAVTAFAIAVAIGGLSACGGGSGGSPAPAPVPAPAPSGIVPSASVAKQCVAPRAGTNDKAGTLDTEKAWVRAFMDETYLWYKEVPQIDPAAAAYTLASNGNDVFKTLTAYFNALKTKSVTASGKLTDQFSFTVTTADLNRQQSGVSSGYGIRWAFISNTPPRVLRVVYVQPGSPAEIAGASRGDTVTSIDGVDINDATTAGIATLNAGISPAVASKTTVFGLQAPGAAAPRNVSITSSQNVTVTPVPLTKVITDGNNKIGYLVLNSFNVVTAEKQLLDAVNQLKTAGVNELVLDLRYNGGGFLDISNQLGWMIGGASLAGKTFEKTSCNDKNPFSICNVADSFQQTTQGFSTGLAAGTPLPQLGLSRVFVLTSSNTCSASESIINGLAPFLQVVRIGSTTCGKPYGFFITDNCGSSYAAIQFKGVNAVGFGDYADGFAPTCQVADDLSKQRGDPSELMLSGALTYLNTGVCPPASSGIKEAKGSKAISEGDFKIMRSPLEEIRILSRPAQQK
jgi:carboxyl-terminal processing protease